MWVWNSTPRTHSMLARSLQLFLARAWLRARKGLLERRVEKVTISIVLVIPTDERRDSYVRKAMDKQIRVAAAAAVVNVQRC